MRGRTLSECFVILDEAQNTTKEQMKMFLTRLGEGTQTVVTGDITQIDLNKRSSSGLLDVISILKSISRWPISSANVCPSAVSCLIGTLWSSIQAMR